MHIRIILRTFKRHGTTPDQLNVYILGVELFSDIPLVILMQWGSRPKTFDAYLPVLEQMPFDLKTTEVTLTFRIYLHLVYMENLQNVCESASCLIFWEKASHFEARWDVSLWRNHQNFITSPENSPHLMYSTSSSVVCKTWPTSESTGEAVKHRWPGLSPRTAVSVGAQVMSMLLVWRGHTLKNTGLVHAHW